MTVQKRLPDAEFEVMEAVWQADSPATAGMIMEKLKNRDEKVRKTQTVHTLLARLEDRGFLTSEKKGKERFFTPLIERNEYLQFETRHFMQQYYSGSCFNLVNTMYQGRELSDDEIEELVKWANERRK